MADGPEREALRASLAIEHEYIVGGMTKAMNIGVIDEIIDPRQTRRRIGETLASSPADRRQRGNIPL